MLKTKNVLLVLLFTSVFTLTAIPALQAAKAPKEDTASKAEAGKDGKAAKEATPNLPRLVRWTLNLGFCVLMLGSLLCLYRILVGPHLADRVLATDALGLHIVGVAILIITATELVSYFDAVLVIALVGFASTFAFAQFIARRHSDHAEAVWKENVAQSDTVNSANSTAS